jgi:8-oxo-dGTP diphosphatase
MSFYSEQQKFFFAVDCVLFGYDDDGIKVLLSKRIAEPLKGKWGLIGAL